MVENDFTIISISIISVIPDVINWSSWWDCQKLWEDSDTRLECDEKKIILIS